MGTKQTVVIGLLGSALDGGRGPERWERWRPTVALCQFEDLLVHRLELLYEPRFVKLCDVVCQDLASVSPETEVRRHSIDLKDPWDFQDVYEALHGFARSYPFAPESEEYLIHITTGSHVEQICLFLLTESRYLPGKLIQTSPPSRQRGEAGQFNLIDLDLSRYDRIASRFQLEARESTSFLKSGIETRNPHFNRLIERIEQVAANSRSPILLMGPTGAGKSQLARRIYELKKQRRQLTGRFVEVNCATIRGDGAMSALFGHTRGSFTGALQDRPGLLRAADGGMLFLDEAAELGLDEQAMLLRAVEERRFLPVGSDKEVRSDFQLIAGTNCDLAQAVALGQFREDLLARINLWTFRLPPLRERPEDIAPNLEYELEQYARLQGTKVGFNKEARDAFLAFAMAPDAVWMGNFRDLNAAITRMATLAPGGRITRPVVEDEIERLRTSWQREQPRCAADREIVRAMDAAAFAQLDLFDQVQLAEVIRVCRSSRSLSEAGRRLFAASRTRKGSANDADRLRKYLARFSLDWARISATLP